MEEQPAANGRVTNNEASRNERDVANRIQPENVELDGDLNGSVQLLPEDPKKAKSAQSTSVIVVGAGPVGMFLALRLGKAKINVVVIEKEEALNDDPRAVGYFGASALAMLNAGVYEKIREEGFMIKGLCWRKKPVEDAELGGKRLGEMIAAMPLAELDDDEMIPPRGLLCLQQAFLTKLLSREAIATGHVSVLFKHQLVAIRDELTSITATARDDRDGSLHNITGSFLAGTDGGRSATRKLLGIPMVGHTWPERLLATDVMVPNLERPNYHCHYVLDRTNFTVSTPLEEPTGNQTTLWRYTMALDPNDDRSDEEILSKSHIMSLYEKVMAGPRPLKADIVRSSTYRIHQRLATTLRMGRSLLAGDAAHMCSPYGALGLNSGILDADALADTITMILNELKPMSLLDIYSDERRKVFQFFVDPTSTHNKLRVQYNDQDTATRDDWFFRLLQNPTQNTLMELGKPYFEDWPTNMRELAAAS